MLANILAGVFTESQIACTRGILFDLRSVYVPKRIPVSASFGHSSECVESQEEPF